MSRRAQRGAAVKRAASADAAAALPQRKLAFERILACVSRSPSFNGVEFLKASVRKERGVYMLSAVIDSEDGVSTQLCESISRAITRMSDSLPPPLPPYQVEVSSAGLERPLTSPAHYARFTGRVVKVVTTQVLQQRTVFSGAIAAAGDEYVTIDDPHAGRSEIPYAIIKRAHLVYDARADLRKTRPT
jgi:ribosome maturation factor RimP